MSGINHYTPATIKRDVELWNEEDPKSLLRLLAPGVASKVKEAYKKAPDLFTLDEKTLYRTFRTNDKYVTPTPTDNRIRLAFWTEFDRAQYQNAKEMRMAYVYSGACTKQLFYDQFLNIPQKVAWMLCPPASYETIVEEALAFGIDKLRDILEMDEFEYDVRGRKKLNTKLLELKAKIVAMLDQRVRGSVVQRVEQKTLNLSVTEKSAERKADENHMEYLERRLKELERKAKSGATPQVVHKEEESS